ncbi:MAG: MFS transporter [Bacteroidaceae bacterium]|nr:MFS transporter [Bacteroidaceae bacterium]
MNTKIRLTLMNLLQYAVWGAYLTCIGNFLGRVGLGIYIPWFYVAQGVVSIFMPALIGMIADKYVQPQRLLGLCHLAAGGFMLLTAYNGAQPSPTIESVFIPYFLSVAFYMPTLALSNAVAFNILRQNGFDTVKEFPPIRVFGTVGFISIMWFVNFTTFGMAQPAQFTYMQLVISGTLGVILGLYCFTLQKCPIVKTDAIQQKTLMQRLGFDAFVLFRQRKMALFFIFSMLLGICLQVTNGYATPYINSFAATGTSWFAKNPTLLVSVSQMSEILCILTIPFFLKRFGIKYVLATALFAWVMRFGLFGVGTTETTLGLIALFASCIIYGVAFDFFNVSASLYVEQEAPQHIRASAQGLLLLMTNGLGAAIGTWATGEIINHYCAWGTDYLLSRPEYNGAGWQTCWFIFASYALIVGILFITMFKNPKSEERG